MAKNPIRLGHLYAIRFTSPDSHEKGKQVLDGLGNLDRELPVYWGRDIVLMEQETGFRRGIDFVYTEAEYKSEKDMQKDLDDEQKRCSDQEQQRMKGEEIVVIHFRDPGEEPKAYTRLIESKVYYEPLLFGCMRTQRKTLDLLHDCNIEETDVREWMTDTPEAEVRREKYIDKLHELFPKRGDKPE